MTPPASRIQTHVNVPDDSSACEGTEVGAPDVSPPVVPDAVVGAGSPEEVAGPDVATGSVVEEVSCASMRASWARATACTAVGRLVDTLGAAEIAALDERGAAAMRAMAPNAAMPTAIRAVR